MNKLISIVVPTFNHANFLRLAILSVINQTYQDWEMIIVDNHSVDGTEEMVKNFNDHRISFFKINNRGVIASSRNKGIYISKGEWIAFLDSDDLWNPKRLEIFINSVCNKNEIDVWSSDEYYVDALKKIRRPLRYGPFVKPFYEHLLKNGNCLSPSATIVRRQFIIDNNVYFREQAEFITAEDYDFWLNLARAGGKFKFSREVLGDFTIHENNNSKRSEIHKQNTLNVLLDHVYYKQEFSDNRNKLWANVFYRRQFLNALVCLKNREWGAGFKKLLEAMYMSPLSCVEETFWTIRKAFWKMSFK